MIIVGLVSLIEYFFKSKEREKKKTVDRGLEKFSHVVLLHADEKRCSACFLLPSVAPRPVVNKSSQTLAVLVHPPLSHQTPSLHPLHPPHQKKRRKKASALEVSHC